MEIKYKKGKWNQNADAPSRIQLNITKKLLTNSRDIVDEELQKTTAASTQLYFPQLDDSQSRIINFDPEEENNFVNQ